MFAALRGSFLSIARSALCVGVFASVAIISGACSSDPTPGAPTCDDAKCAAGNKCLVLNGENKCRKTCTSNDDPATSCPYGYTCRDTLTGAPPFCVQDKAVNADGKPLTQKAGQWGTKCQANLGIQNPGCDGDQGFFCYGNSPTDGDAYCTRYDCTSDEECGAGFWCGKINQTPNVQTAKRSTIGETQNVCLRRSYCSTCNVDLDCPPIAGTKQHCIPDANGANFCAPECQGSTNCPNEAKCVDAGVGAVGANVCYPRATVCVGDGSLCAPCRSDADCGADGVCVKGQYTTEHACAKKAPQSCNKGKAAGGCPAKTGTNPAIDVRCLGGTFDEVPEDYCHGIYFIGSDGGDIGCWTPKR